MEQEITKVCNTCEVEKPLSKFKIAWAVVNQKGGKQSGWAQANPVQARRNRCAACDSKSDTAKLKLEMLEAFGFKCSCCGENHPDFLTLDHVLEDGAEHRKTMNCQQAMRLARRQNWDKAKWDCLCITCNFAKSHYGGCPHKTGLTAEMALERLRGRNKKIGRALVNYNKQSWFKPGPDPRRGDVRAKLAYARQVLKEQRAQAQERST